MSLIWKLEHGEPLEAHEVQLLVKLLRLCPPEMFDAGSIERAIVESAN